MFRSFTSVTGVQIPSGTLNFFDTRSRETTGCSRHDAVIRTAALQSDRAARLCVLDTSRRTHRHPPRNQIYLPEPDSFSRIRARTLKVFCDLDPVQSASGTPIYRAFKFDAVRTSPREIGRAPCR